MYDTNSDPDLFTPADIRNWQRKIERLTCSAFDPLIEACARRPSAGDDRYSKPERNQMSPAILRADRLRREDFELVPSLR